MENGGSFLTGLAQGFGKSFLQRRQQQHAEDLDKEANQYRMFKDALGVAAQRGDTNAVSHIFKSMEEFSNESGKGKQGKANQAGILSKFADMLQSGRQENVTSQTPESVQAGQQNEGLAPEDQSRPRLATQTSVVNKPLLLSNQELTNQENQSLLERQRILAPGIRTEKNAEAEDITKRQLSLDKQKAEDRERLFKMQTEAKQTGDVDKLAYAYSQQYNLPIEQVREMAGRTITQFQEARTSDLNSRIQSRKDTVDWHNKNYDLRKSHYAALEQRAREASVRGDKSLSIRIQKAASGSKELYQSAQLDMGRQKEIQSEINRLEGIVSNPMGQDNPKIQEYRKNLDDLTKQWKELNDKITNKGEQLDTIYKDLEEKRLSTSSGTPKKTLTNNRKFTVIREKATGKRFKFYGNKPDGSPDMEEIQQQP